MKAAMMNQNTLPLVAPPGPLASAPVASENDGLYYYDNVTGKAYISRKKTCKFIDQSSIPHYYCDSVNGSDSNDGHTSATPKQTASAVKSLAITACVLEFARGSYFREELSGLPTNSIVKAYGIGDRPVFDCADVTSAFTKTVGYTNVWQKSFSNSLTISGKTKASMWFDATRMIRVSSMALCDSTQGSFYCALTHSGNDIIYFHSPTSADPNSDGKVYEIAVRKYGVQMSNGSECYNVRTQRNGHNDGSLIGTKYISDCYGYDGTTHNIWNGGIAEYCTAERCECETIGSSTAFVSYVDVADYSTTFRYTGCKAMGIGAALYGWKEAVCAAFLAHTASSLNPIKHVLFESCESNGFGTFGSANAKDLVYINCDSVSTVYAYGVGKERTFLTKSKHRYKTNSGATLRTAQRSIEGSGCPIVSIKGCAFCVNSGAGGGFIYGSLGASVNIVNSDFIQQLTTGAIPVQNNTGASTSINLMKCIVDGTQASRSYFTQSSAGLSMVSDKNLFASDTACNGSYNGTAYANLTAWKVLTGNDANSLVGSAQFSGDPSIGNFAVNVASPANTLLAGSENYTVTADDLHKCNIWDQV